MKNNLLIYICALCTALALTLLAGCAAEDILPPGSYDGDTEDFAVVKDDKVVVNIAVDMPGMMTTRAMGSTPDYDDMHLYLVEFDDNGSPLSNTLKTVYTPEEETPQSDRVVYKVTLNQSDQARVLHLIALPKDKELTLDYGVEAAIIPTLKTEGETPAYWRRLSFPSGYSSESGGTTTLAPELQQLRHVALIRNFAAVSVEDRADNFTLTGFAVINDPMAGTIAPYRVSDHSFPEFLTSGEGDRMVPKEFTELAAAYKGISPASLTLSNLDTAPQVDDDLEPKYLYERPFNSIRHTYIIIKGRRQGSEKESYYKLDLGANDSNGVFGYYSILRNYNYRIVLRNVASDGYDTALKAAQGVVYNNFSFDIELSSMLNISDGSEVVYVNFTTAVITNPDGEALDFKYRYRNLSASTPTYNNSDVTFIDLKPGDVIKSVTIADADDADGWRNVHIECYPAQAETHTQSFTIVKSSGLGRTVNLILHRKWTLANVKEFAGQLENWNADTPYEGIAGGSDGDDLTIFFDLPDNLEEAMFPMTFTLEADRQNIENNPIGLLVVNYGNSGFSNLPGFSNIQGRRIKYEKTVTWTQYNDPLNDKMVDDHGTAIRNPDGTVTHRVRCRFRTINDLANEDVEDTETNVLITNDNFNYAIVKFRRRRGISPVGG